MDTPHHQRLDRLMEARRLDLDMTWDDVALTAKISVATLRAIRRGETDPRGITKRRLESALRWKAGSFDAVVAGGEPAVDEPPGSAPSTAKPVNEDPDEARIRELSSFSEGEKELLIALLRARRADEQKETGS